MDVALIGPGRLGRSLAILLPAAGHRVLLVGRGEAIPACDLVWITTPDRALEAVARQLPPGVPALHSAGSRGADALAPHAPSGLLHPLMTFPGPELGLPSLAGVGAAIAGDPPAEACARQLAGDLGMVPFPAPREPALYHAAAAIAGNYIPVLLAEAARVLAAAGVSNGTALLAPLAIESLHNAVRAPDRALTGPAARGDLDTLARHREALRAADLSEVSLLADALAERALALTKRSL